MTDIDDFLNTPQRPIGPVKPKKKRGPAANLRRDTIKAIQGLKYLGSRPCVIPVFTGQIEIDGKQHFLGRMGASDLICCWHGHCFGIELKAKGDSQRPTQAKFEGRLQTAGGTYVIVRQPQDALDAMMRWYKQHVAKLQPRG